MPTEKLPVQLSQEERNMKARNVAALLKRYSELESAAKSAAASYKDQLKELRTEIDRDAEAAHNGYEERDVDLRNEPDPETFQVRIVRADTGEVVRTRDMTTEEMRAARQQNLPLNDQNNVTPIAAKDRNAAATIKGSKKEN